MTRLAMRGVLLFAVVLLASAPVLPANMNVGGSRSAKSGKGPQDLPAWLARLKGTYSIALNEDQKTTCRALGPSTGSSIDVCTTQKARAYKSTMSCVGIGEGPGVHCTISELSVEIPGSGAGTSAPASLISNSLPVRLLFGIDPGDGMATVMIMDPSGASHVASGSLQRDDVTFKGKCGFPESRNSSPCTFTFRIHAPPDEGRIRMIRTSRGDSRSFDLSRMQE